MSSSVPFQCPCLSFLTILCPWSNQVSRWQCCQKDREKQMTQIQFYICASLYKSLVLFLKCFSGQRSFKIPLQQLLAVLDLFFLFSVYQILFQPGIYSSQCNTESQLRIHFSFPGKVAISNNKSSILFYKIPNQHKPLLSTQSHTYIDPQQCVCV